MAKAVREPIQVYLTSGEREELDRAARELGVSRSEVLRRGVEAVGRAHVGSGVLRDLAEQGYVTPAQAHPAGPPPRGGGMRLEDLMRELDRDRSDR